MTRKIDIPHELNAGRIVKIRGVLTRASLSPQDFPTSADVTYDKENNKLIVLFQYEDGNEATNEHDSGAHVKIFVGRKTGRLFKLVVSGVSNPSEIPNIAIEAVVRIQGSQEKSDTDYPTMKGLNYTVAKAFLEKNKSELVAS